MPEFVFIFAFLSIPIIIVISISLFQIRRSQIILRKLDHLKLNKVNIRFNQALMGIGNVSGGLPIKAIMYFNDDVILIRPKINGYFNGIFNINLPLVFIREASMSSTIKIRPLRIADKIKISAWKSITIKYKKPGVSYSIQINLLDKREFEVVELLRLWEK